MPYNPEKAHRWPEGHSNLRTEAIFKCLQKWHDAMVFNVVDKFTPDPFYKRLNNRSDWSEEDIIRIVDSIDEETIEEVENKNKHHWNGQLIYKGTRFRELPLIQKIALVQELDYIINTVPDENKPVKEPDNSPQAEPSPYDVFGYI